TDATLRNINNAAAKSMGSDSTAYTEFKDPANQKAIIDKLTGFLKTDSELDSSLSANKGNVDIAKDSLKNGTSTATKEGNKALQTEFDDLSAKKAANADAMVKYIDGIAPQKTALGTKVAGYIRNSMLSGLSGRFRHGANTVINSADTSLSSMLSGLVGKALNKVTGKSGKFVDSGITPGDLLGGLAKLPGKVMSDLRGDSGLQGA